MMIEKETVISVVSWFAMSLSLVGYVLNALRKIQCWAVWIVSNVIWAEVAWLMGNTPLFLLQIVCGGIAFYGWFAWAVAGMTKEKEKGNE